MKREALEVRRRRSRSSGEMLAVPDSLRIRLAALDDHFWRLPLVCFGTAASAYGDPCRNRALGYESGRSARPGKHFWVPPGLMDDDLEVSLALHHHVASKADWDEIPDHVPQFDAYPPPGVVFGDGS